MKRKITIKHYIRWTINLINVLWWKFLFLFGVKRSASPIPIGMYCYTPDIEKNEKRENFSTYYIKPCKYYKKLGREYNGCSYLGIITDDMTFDDQCKMCGENYGDDDE
jgi:hypothetical protein